MGQSLLTGLEASSTWTMYIAARLCHMVPTIKSELRLLIPHSLQFIAHNTLTTFAQILSIANDTSFPRESGISAVVQPNQMAFSWEAIFSLIALFVAIATLLIKDFSLAQRSAS